METTERMEETKKERVNGINTAVLAQTVQTVSKETEQGQFVFRVNNKWNNGTKNVSVVGPFYGLNEENYHQTSLTIESDEPALLAGTDSSPNPVEHQLSALAACLTTSMVAHAAVRGVEIEEIESHLEGDIDLRGFFGISKEVRKGYENIRVNFKVKTKEKNLNKLKELCEFSPVYDVTRRGTNVELNVERLN